MSIETPAPKTSPAWHFEKMNSRIMGRDAHCRFKRSEAVATTIGGRLQARAEEAAEEFKQSAPFQRYQNAREQFVTLDAELQAARIVESQLQVAHNQAIGSGESTGEVSTHWKAARDLVADLTTRRDSTKELMDIAYLAAVQAYQHVGEAAFSDTFATANRDREAAIKELCAVASPVLDRILDATARLTRMENSQAIFMPLVEKVISPLPQSERLAEPPVYVMNQRSPVPHAAMA